MSAAITLDMLRAASSADFPVIDLGPYMRGDEGALDRVAAELCHALENIGFLIVVNHGLAAELTDGIVDEARRFHALPLDKKLKLATGRASMIPSSTGAAKALKLVIPAMDGKLDGFAIRVPTPNVSVVDLTFVSEKPITVGAVNEALKKASDGELKPYLGYTDEELVSSDFKGNALSSIVDSKLTKVIGNTGKVISWYDNEWGYSNRVKDLITFLVKKGL